MAGLLGALVSGAAAVVAPAIGSCILVVKRPTHIDIPRLRLESRGVRPVVPYSAPVPYTGGRVRALFIGINYTGTSMELKGSINDVDQMIGSLRRIAFPISECCILVDNPSFPNFTAIPTRENIARHLAWLTADARPGDVLFLQYSGHGGQTKATEDTEEKYDQCVIPLDYEANGAILDDDLFNLLVRDLPKGVRMTCVFDCCHSASMLDLPFSFVTRHSYDAQSTTYSMVSLRRNNFSCGDVIMFSGCEDTDTSADIQSSETTVAGGAATQAFTWALVYTRDLSYIQMLLKTRDILAAKGFSQVPQLTSSKPMNLYKPFSLFGTISVDQHMMETYVPMQYRFVSSPSNASVNNSACTSQASPYYCPQTAPPQSPQAYQPPSQPQQPQPQQPQYHPAQVYPTAPAYNYPSYQPTPPAQQYYYYYAPYPPPQAQQQYYYYQQN